MNTTKNKIKMYDLLGLMDDYYNDSYLFKDFSLFKDLFLFEKENSYSKLKEEKQFKSDKAIIRIEVPGIKPENVIVFHENGYVVVSVAQSQENDKSGGYITSKHHIPEKYDLDKMTASMSLGVLTIEIQAREEVKPKPIKINVL